MNILEILLVFGGLVAGAVLGVVCLVGLVVWLAGGRAVPPKKV